MVTFSLSAHSSSIHDGDLAVAAALLVVPFRCAGLFGALLAFPLPRTVDKYAQIVLESVSKIPAVYFMYVPHGNESKKFKIAGMNAFPNSALWGRLLDCSRACSALSDGNLGKKTSGVQSEKVKDPIRTIKSVSTLALDRVENMAPSQS